MTTFELFQGLVYLDTSFLSSYYECITDAHATTNFTYEKEKRADAGIAAFSGGLSVVETKSYSLSSLRMLEKAYVGLNKIPSVDFDKLAITKKSIFGWVDGELSIGVTRTFKPTSTGEQTYFGEERFFSLLRTGAKPLAMITSEEYFQSGMGAISRLHSVDLLDNFSINARVLMRALPSQTRFDHVVVLPFIIFEI